MPQSLPARLAIAVLFVVSASACANTHSNLKEDGADVSTFRIEYTNIHLVQRDGKTVMIDAGYQSTASELETLLKEAGVKPDAIAAIIITHGHADHAGGAKRFAETYNTPVVAGAGDKEMMEVGKHEEPLCPTDFMAEMRVEEDQAATYTPYPVSKWVSEKTPLTTVGGPEGWILPMAGHTPGSLTVVIGEHAFVGDLFRGSLVGASTTTHFYMCDLADNLEDIEGLLSDYPNVKVFFPGHFGPISREDVEAYVGEHP